MAGRISYNELTVADKLNIFCPSRDIARQTSAQTMCISSERSSLVSFNPIFVEIFRFCKLTALTELSPVSLTYDIFDSCLA